MPVHSTVNVSLTPSDPQDEASALFQRALAFEIGRGVRINVADALRWYLRAAALDHVDAQWHAARLLMRGATSSEEASWLKAAAHRRADPPGQRIARFFPNGFDVAADVGAALPWLMRAATAGHAEACFALAALFLDGQHVEQRLDLARRSFEKAAARGHGPSFFKLGDIYFQGLGVLPDPTRAADWYEAAARTDVALAKYALSTLYRDGIGRPRDLALSLQLLSEAADAGVPAALVQLAQLSLAGTDVPQDREGAETLLRVAAKGNYVRAFIALAEMFSRGAGVQPDLREAAYWYRRAADAGDSEAQFIMGHLAATGRGVPLDLAEAAGWFEKAAAQGHATAAHNLASIYLQGHGSGASEAGALDLLKRAADAGVLASEIRYAELLGSAADRERLGRLRVRVATDGSPDQKGRVARLLLQCDPPEAEALLRAAVSEGDAPSTIALGRMCASRGNPSSMDEAVALFRRAAQDSDPDIRFDAAHDLLEIGGHDTEAAAIFASTADAGHIPSHVLMGVLTSTGRGIETNHRQAVAHYEIAAGANHPIALFNLGVLLLRGLGCPTDGARGRGLIERAAALGVEEAKAWASRQELAASRADGLPE